MRALLAALLLAAPAARAQEDAEGTALQPHLAGLHLGDDLDTVRRLYPPRVEWPRTKDPRTRVTRYRVDRGQALEFPRRVQTLFFGLKGGRVVEIEAVYDEEYSRSMGHERLAGEYALLYGQPRRSGDHFWWDDGRLVLRVFPAEIAAGAEGAAVSSRAAVDDGSGPGAAYVVWRTAVQLYRAGAYDTSGPPRTDAFGRRP